MTHKEKETGTKTETDTEKQLLWDYKSDDFIGRPGYLMVLVVDLHANVYVQLFVQRNEFTSGWRTALYKK